MVCLIKCPVCGKSVSSDSFACPGCGHTNVSKGSGQNLIVDKSTKCVNCRKEITSQGWKFAAVTETPHETLIFCCSNCRLNAGYGGTGRICTVIPEGAPIPKRSGCYVATCVYKSYDCPEVWTFRRFRDNTLLCTWYGKQFVRVYYSVSPKIVKSFGNKKWFNKLWKPVLDRFAILLHNRGVDNSPYSD